MMRETGQNARTHRLEGVTDPTPEAARPSPKPARPTPAAPVRARLLSTPVTVLWFAALVVWASGRALEVIGVTPGVIVPGISGTSLAVLFGAIGLGALYRRRGFDALTRTPAVSAVVMAIASALASVGVLALLVIGPDRPIGAIDLEVGATVALTTAAASASTVVLIRPYVDPMVAHVWAGIAGAGLALPFMIAGVSPAFVMAAAITLGIVDRARGARFEREVAFRKQLEADYAAEHGDDGRGIGVSGLPGMPPLPRAPQPQRPWSAGERRATLWLGVAAVLIVAIAWTTGSALAEAGLLVPGQGFGLASLGAIPLIAQVALLLRVASHLRRALIVADGMFLAASLLIVFAPLASVEGSLSPGLSAILGTVLSAGLSADLGSALGEAGIALQSISLAVLTAMALRQLGRGSAPALMLAVCAAIVWWLIVLPSGALVLAFAAVATTLIALRRKVHS